MATRLFGNAKRGSTSISLDMALLKTADGTPDAGKVAADLTAYYHLSGAATVTVTLSDLAALTTAWTSGGVKEVTGGDGIYRVDWPDAAFASGDYVTLVLKDGSTSIAMERLSLEAHGADDVAVDVAAVKAKTDALPSLFPSVDGSGRVTATTPESLAGTVVSATTTSVVFSATGGVPTSGQTSNAYAGTTPRYLTFISGTNKGLCVTITGSAYSGGNLTVNFAASAGVIAATAGDAVQVD